MVFKKLSNLLTIVLLLSTNTDAANLRKNVLFIGNSFTSRNKMPFLFRKIAHKNNEKVKVYQSTKGSYTWNMHSQDKDTISMIKKRKYEAVVMQEQSMFLSRTSSFYRIQSFPFLEKLDETIDGKIHLFLTWGYYNGIEFGDNYYNMQNRLIDGYRDSVKTIKHNKVDISPV